MGRSLALEALPDNPRQMSYQQLAVEIILKVSGVVPGGGRGGSIRVFAQSLLDLRMAQSSPRSR